MVGNNYLDRLSKYSDENFALNILLDDLNILSDEFIEYMQNNVPNLNEITEVERIFLTKTTCLIEYFFINNDINVPLWITDDRLVLTEPYVFGAREKDIWYLKTILSSPPVFKAKNVYFDLGALKRV
ncbi:hypothetical protein DIC82_05605 [Clostridium beijerinckii]|nr:hypothetical protein DIC82_05605 [Clostridium beijerinckii]